MRETPTPNSFHWFFTVILHPMQTLQTTLRSKGYGFVFLVSLLLAIEFTLPNALITYFSFGPTKNSLAHLAQSFLPVLTFFGTLVFFLLSLAFLIFFVGAALMGDADYKQCVLTLAQLGAGLLWFPLCLVPFIFMPKLITRVAYRCLFTLACLWLTVIGVKAITLIQDHFSNWIGLLNLLGALLIYYGVSAFILIETGLKLHFGF